MFFLNPLKLFVLPFAFLVALPLAFCAGATTILAFLVLFLRLFLVYFDLGLETLRHILVGHATQAHHIASRRTPVSSMSPTPLSSPVATSFRHRRRAKRRGSGGSGSVTPVSSFDGVSAVAPSVGLERDFEGIGGWRWDDINERRWYNLNSRLESPYRRHHFRSQSGGVLMSGPATSRTATGPKSVTASHSPERFQLAPCPSRRNSKIPSINEPQGVY